MDKINMQSVTKKYEIYYLYLFIWGYLCCQNTKLTPSCWGIWCRFHVKHKVRKWENRSVFMLFITKENVLLSNNGMALKLRKRVQQHPRRKECSKLLGYFRPHDNFARMRLIFFPKIVAVNQLLSFGEQGKKKIYQNQPFFFYVPDLIDDSLKVNIHILIFYEHLLLGIPTFISTSQAPVWDTYMENSLLIPSHMSNWEPF